MQPHDDFELSAAVKVAYTVCECIYRTDKRLKDLPNHVKEDIATAAMLPFCTHIADRIGSTLPVPIPHAFVFAWFKTALPRRAIDYIREQQRQRVHDSDLQEFIRARARHFVDGTQELDKWTLDTIDTLKAATAKLPQRHREVVNLLLEHNSAHDIAVILNRPVVTVHKQISAAIQRLRILMS